ncbi:MAG: hypothetical protein JO148_09055 [Acidimicrobiia bacterium]|nr:hypothetical protein [Acidimicrobiia bacterium]
MTTLDDTLHAHAARQLGLLTRADVLGRGGTDKYIRTRLANRHWRELHPGVYLTGSASPSWLQRALAACLACGPNSVLSHRAAATLHWLDGSNEGVVELTSAQTKCPRPRGTVLHRTLRWDPVDRTVKRLVPVTAVNRTLIDYGAVVPPILVERAVEDAFRRGLTSEGALRRRLAQVGGSGCRGSGVLRKVLDLRPEGRPARSGFEVMLLDVIREYGLPIPVRNYPVEVDGTIVAEIDLAYPDRLGALEAMGAKWHSTARQVRRDEERKAMLRALGWTVEDFEWDEVVNRPQAAAARIDAFLCASSGG